MKKLIYIFLTVLIVACSSSGGNGQSLNTQFVGSWENGIDDEFNSIDIKQFNADGSGSSSEITNGETYFNGTFSWSTTNTIITVSYDYGDTFSAEYDFLSVDQVKFTINEQGDVYELFYDRID